MNSRYLRALLWGLGIALYLRYGLEPTAWLFYEASHALGVDWLYWGYSVLRGGAHALTLWQFQSLACFAVGVGLALIILWRSNKRVVP
jgi:hypothetical protein